MRTKIFSLHKLVSKAWTTWSSYYSNINDQSGSKAFEFSLKLFTEFSEFSDIN